jgi:hypothetical protein
LDIKVELRESDALITRARQSDDVVSRRSAAAAPSASSAPDNLYAF